MPTVLRHGPYSFRFFSSDAGEPPHIHVKREQYSAKFWLDPVRLAVNHEYRPQELNRIERLVADYEEILLEAWHVHFESGA